MGQNQLHKDIRSQGGYIMSDGTLNTQHILPKAYDLIIGYNLQNTKHTNVQTITSDILKCFRGDVKPDQSLFTQQYYGEIKLIADKYDDWINQIGFTADELWNDNIYDFFNEIAPSGYYFGSSEGDGACIGWFKYKDNE